MTNVSSELAGKLAALKVSFAAKLEGRFTEIEDAISGLHSSKEAVAHAEHLDMILNGAHKLAGSAKTFGFPSLGEIASQMASLCVQISKEGKPPTTADEDRIDELMEAMRNSKEA